MVPSTCLNINSIGFSDRLEVVPYCCVQFIVFAPPFKKHKKSVLRDVVAD